MKLIVKTEELGGTNNFSGYPENTVLHKAICARCKRINEYIKQYCKDRRVSYKNKDKSELEISAEARRWEIRNPEFYRKFQTTEMCSECSYELFTVPKEKNQQKLRRMYYW